MKRRDLIRLMLKSGWTLMRQGGSHEVWTDGVNTEMIPRHREIDERLARTIIKKWSLKK